MTKVKFLDDHLGTHVGFEMSGHAEYAKRGKEDIVCSALSMLMTNTVNSLEYLCNAEYDLEENPKDGYVKVIITSEITHDMEVLMSSFILGVSYLEKSYPKNVKMIIEEVQSC